MNKYEYEEKFVKYHSVTIMRIIYWCILIGLGFLILFILYKRQSDVRKIKVTFLGYKVASVKNIEAPIDQDDQLYQLVLEEIKTHEGLRLCPYKCPAGYWTVGYGHQTDDSLSCITKEDAEVLLIVDFDNKCIIVSEMYPSLEYNRFLALSHIAYCLGQGTLRSMNLDELIESNKPIGSVLMQYCYYKDRNGVMRFSENLYKQRLFELKLYEYANNLALDKN